MAANKFSSLNCCEDDADCKECLVSCHDLLKLLALELDLSCDSCLCVDGWSGKPCDNVFVWNVGLTWNVKAFC